MSAPVTKTAIGDEVNRLRTDLGLIKLSVVTHDDLLVGAKQIVRIEGIGKKLFGCYHVKQTVHTPNRSGGYTKIRMVSDDCDPTRREDTDEQV